jgi:hypothetical protein
VRAGGLLGFSVGLGRRSWMGTCGAVGALASIVAGLVNTLVGGEAGGLLAWRVAGGLLGWLTSWRIGRFLGWLACRSLVGRVGGGSRGLQLLATTVSSTSSSSERIEDVKRIVVASLVLVHKRHVSDNIWCRDIV